MTGSNQPSWLQAGTRRALSGAAGKDGPLTDQRDDYRTGPTAKLGVAGAGRAGKALDPKAGELVRKPTRGRLRRAKSG